MYVCTMYLYSASAYIESAQNMLSEDTQEVTVLWIWILSVFLVPKALFVQEH